jgi:hypothetical protein
MTAAGRAQPRPPAATATGTLAPPPEPSGPRPRSAHPGGLHSKHAPFAYAVVENNKAKLIRIFLQRAPAFARPQRRLVWFLPGLLRGVLPSRRSSQASATTRTSRGLTRPPSRTRTLSPSPAPSFCASSSGPFCDPIVPRTATSDMLSIFPVVFTTFRYFIGFTSMNFITT